METPIGNRYTDAVYMEEWGAKRKTDGRADL